jgi:mono/diheme cytochrome c family protein
MIKPLRESKYFHVLTHLAFLALRVPAWFKKPNEGVTMRAFALLLFLSVTAHADGDPAAGYRYLVNGNYIPCGIPYSLMKRDKLVSDGVFVDPGIPGREGPNANVVADMSVFRSSRGNLVVNNNCLVCHAQRLGGQLIVGLGNSTVDFTTDQAKAMWLLKLLARGEDEKTEIDYFAKVITAIGPMVTTRTRGLNPAINLTYALMAHRDPQTLEWSDRPVVDPPEAVAPPVDTPPWWRMKKRKTMFYSGEITGELHRIMMLASTMCVDNPAQAAGIDAPFKDVEAYIRSLEPPKYPHAIDTNRAEQGRAIFENTCSRCHGTYGKGGVYPELLVPIDVVGTDPGTMELESGASAARWGQWLGKSFYGELSQPGNRGGYVAPALDGIWATGPFLHNGSVPTLEGVLNSRIRPKYWTRSFDSKDYDTVNMGWKYQALKHGQSSISNAFRKSRVYDTTLPGYSNQGHPFGDSLSDAERSAVLEYLKTL